MGQKDEMGLRNWYGELLVTQRVLVYIALISNFLKLDPCEFLQKINYIDCLGLYRVIKDLYYIVRERF